MDLKIINGGQRLVRSTSLDLMPCASVTPIFTWKYFMRVYVAIKHKSLELANTKLYYQREGWILPDRETTRRTSPAVSCVRQQICSDVVRTWKMSARGVMFLPWPHGVISRANWSSERDLVVYNSPPGPDRTAAVAVSVWTRVTPQWMLYLKDWSAEKTAMASRRLIWIEGCQDSLRLSTSPRGPQSEVGG